MEDLYTGNAEGVGREPGLIPRGTQMRNTTIDRNLPNIVADMHKMKVDSDIYSSNMENETLKQEVMRWKSERERLSEQLYQVMRMNTNWQRFNDQRELKDQEKEHERTIMLRQIKMLKEHITMTEEKMMGMKSVDEAILKSEIVELRKQLEIKTAEVEKLKLEKHNNQDSKTMVEFLRQQVNVYVEDFRKERQDREAIQAKYDQTRQELMEAKRTIEKLSRENANYAYRTWEKQPRAYDVGMRSRGIEYQQQQQPTDQYNASGLSEHVEIDGGIGNDNDGLLDDKTDDLQCPACLKKFSFEVHHLLVEHMAKCSIDD